MKTYKCNGCEDDSPLSATCTLTTDDNSGIAPEICPYGWPDEDTNWVQQREKDEQ